MRSGGKCLRADVEGAAALAAAVADNLVSAGAIVSERRRVDAGIMGCHLAILDGSGGDLTALGVDSILI